MENLIFTYDRPKKSGYYYIIWENGEEPILVWINYIIIDNEEFWTWGFSENDDPEDIELDIIEPKKIQFSQLIKK